MMIPAPLPLPRVELSWHTVSLKPGASVFGYPVAQPYGTWVHYNGKASKGCRRLMSGDRLPCLFCGEKKARWYGYLPMLVGPTAERHVFMLSRRSADGFNYSHVFKPTYLKRPEGKGQRYEWGACPAEEVGYKWHSSVSPADHEDLSRYLLNLWQDSVLAEFHGYHLPTPKPNQVVMRSQPPTGQPPDGAPQSTPVSPADLVRSLSHAFAADPAETEPQPKRHPTARANGFHQRPK